ncbi:MAG TPA: DUF4192 domain-containing protein [Actinoplanes sp.]|nr:DUF4192 domain-containing protein [Actinoplanes sp.]
MTADTSLHVSSLHEFLAAVPYLLGFHPADSVVVVALKDRRVLCAARAGCDDPVDHTAEVLVRQGADAAAVIGYGEPVRVTPAVQRMSHALSSRNVPVVDEFRVTGGRYWSYRCKDPDCCPPDGTPCRTAESVVAAQATYDGQVLLPDRAALAARLAPVTGDEQVAMSAATERARDRLTEALPHGIRRTGRAAVRAAEVRYRSGGRLTDDEVAWLGMMLVETRIRDYAWMRTAGEDWRIALWTDVTRRVDPLYVPAPASLLAFAAWRQGQGGLANAALDRALSAEPHYPMAHLIGQILHEGVPPDLIDLTPPRSPHRRHRRGGRGRTHGRTVS